MTNFKKFEQIILFNKEKDQCVDYFYSHTDFTRDIYIFLDESSNVHEFTKEYLFDKLMRG